MRGPKRPVSVWERRIYPLCLVRQTVNKLITKTISRGRRPPPGPPPSYPSLVRDLTSPAITGRRPQVVTSGIRFGYPWHPAAPCFFSVLLPRSGRVHLSGDLTCSAAYPCDCGVHAKRWLADLAPPPSYSVRRLGFSWGLACDWRTSSTTGGAVIPIIPAAFETNMTPFMSFSSDFGDRMTTQHLD